jgi:ATP-binding cassette subfamily B (MDR/TAP) protein 1
MVSVQSYTGGFVPRNDSEVGATDEDQEEIDWILERNEEERREEEAAVHRRHRSAGNMLVNRWMLDVVSDLTRSRAPTPSMFPPPHNQPEASTSGLSDAEKHESNLKRFSTMKASLKRSSTTATCAGRSSTLPKSVTRASFQPPKVTAPSRIYTDVPQLHRRLSLQFTPTSPTGGFKKLPKSLRISKRATQMSSTLQSESTVEDDEEFELEKEAMERSAAEVTRRRKLSEKGKVIRARWDEASLARLSGVTVDDEKREEDCTAQAGELSFVQLVREIYPTLPNKPLIFFGMFICVLSGAMTPLFSFLLSRLLFEVSIGAGNVSTINTFGGIVLGVAASDGFLLGLKFFVMEAAGMSWVTTLRKRCYEIILSQDKKWFDKSENSPVRLVQILIKDGDDARNLIAVVLGQCLVVSAMLGVGLVWALARGWQLTLAGFAIGPVFAVTMAVQANLVGNVERRNKAAREEVAKGYYEAISNIRAIRCMSLGSVFRRQFDESVEKAHLSGVRGAFVEGCTYGVASGLIYLAEALLFFVGAVLVSQGTYSYLQMVEVLNLVVFTVTIGSQLMAFSECSAFFLSNTCADDISTSSTHCQGDSGRTRLQPNQVAGYGHRRIHWKDEAHDRW